MKNALIIGGSSGLGLELAKQLSNDYAVSVTGRTDPKESSLTFYELHLDDENMVAHLQKIIESIGEIDLLIHAAGFFQDGRVTDLSDDDIEAMIDVGGRSLIYAVREILTKQDSLNELIAITSTSQWTPRQYEPIYNFVKAGAAHFTNAMAEDGRVQKVLVAGPAGMDTAFWRDDTERDDKIAYNDPKDVAAEIMKLRENDYAYQFAKILRDPLRVEIAEKR